MDSLAWRSRARVVAYVDLVLTTISLLLVMLFTFLIGTGTAAYVTQKDDVTPDEQEAYTVVMWWGWMFLAIFGLMTAIQMWASFKLLNASEVGKAAYEALDNARIWRNVSIVFLILGSVSNIMVGQITITIVSVLWRSLFLFIVYKFMKGLEYIITGSSNGVSVVSGSGLNEPHNVIVNKM